MITHLLFDILSYTVGGILATKVFRPQKHIIQHEATRYIYYTLIIAGAFVGAIIIGTLNTYISTDDTYILGKSILGALTGGIIVVEVFKKIIGIKGSTGAYFVPSLAVGIAIGRVGCFLSGLDDYTYGIQTDHLFAVDFGDGVLRHPVQLYESFFMLLFFVYATVIFYKNKVRFETTMFYQFVLFYATQRFFIEFLKPYETIYWELNIFQWLCFGLVFYSIIHLKYFIYRSEM